MLAMVSLNAFPIKTCLTCAAGALDLPIVKELPNNFMAKNYSEGPSRADTRKLKYESGKEDDEEEDDIIGHLHLQKPQVLLRVGSWIMKK